MDSLERESHRAYGHGKFGFLLSFKPESDNFFFKDLPVCGVQNARRETGQETETIRWLY